MTIKRIRKIKGTVVRDIETGEEYVDIPTYAIKQKLDEIVETVNGVLDLLQKGQNNDGKFREGYVIVDPEIPVNEEGHDEACNSGIGLECDCWRDEKIRKQASEAIAKMKK